ncbi:hypothetical protein [Corynebacterium sp.]|uniref:hypothetical protein n=1 Tax=Corynebacterium sp. TaxID=1720 RepID=UPI0026DFE16E|nr:hypothetical protein [Corynebacterium sp.]MDO5513447.1 hypothetical protein [Corynebacterium sp.]
MTTAPVSVLLSLCASILASVLGYTWWARESPSGAMVSFLLPAIIGALLLPWRPARRQGIALMLGPLVVIATFVVGIVGIVVVGGAWSMIQR